MRKLNYRDTNRNTERGRGRGRHRHTHTTQCTFCQMVVFERMGSGSGSCMLVAPTSKKTNKKKVHTRSFISPTTTTTLFRIIFEEKKGKLLKRWEGDGIDWVVVEHPPEIHKKKLIWSSKLIFYWKWYDRYDDRHYRINRNSNFFVHFILLN